MQLISNIAVLAGLASAVAAVSGTDEVFALSPRAGCVKGVHVVALGGQGTTNGDLGYLASMADGIVERIPNSELVQIGYPQGALGPQAIEYAIPILRNHLEQYSKECPKTQIVLASYSIGAAATMDVLCGSPQNGTGALATMYRKHIVANAVYGDLTFHPHLSYNRGTCTQKGGLVERQKPGACYPFGAKTHSWCDSGDENCCSGHDYNVHFSYPAKYDAKAIDFVQNRFQHWKHHEAKLAKEGKKHD